MPYKKVGLICTSDFVGSLVPALNRIGFEIRAIWCPTPDVSIQTAAENDIPFVSNKPEEILTRKDVELLVITGRPSSHARLCSKALGLGKHVLCSAPAALTLKDATSMVQAARFYPQMLSLIGFGMRQLEVFRRMRKLLQRNHVGRPLVAEIRVQAPPLFSPDQYDWLWEGAGGGGLLNIIGCHVIDLLQFLLDRKAVRAQGLVQTHSRKKRLDFVENGGFRRLDADDFCSFLLRMPEMSASVTLNSINDTEFEQEVCITCSEGQLVARNFQLFAFHNGCHAEQLLFDEYAQENENGSNFPVLLGQNSLYYLPNSPQSSQNGSLNLSSPSISSLRRQSTDRSLTVSVNGHQNANNINNNNNIINNNNNNIINNNNDNSNNINHQMPSPGSAESHQSFFTGSSVTAHEDQLLYSPVPRLELYEKGFSKLLEALAAAIPHYDEKLERSAASWKEIIPHLASVASFSDVQYVIAVIEAIRFSSDNGDWVKIIGY